MRKTTLKQRLHAVHAAERKAARRKTHATRARLYGAEMAAVAAQAKIRRRLAARGISSRSGVGVSKLLGAILRRNYGN